MGTSERDAHIQMGELSIRLDALRLLWDLEDRGIDLCIASDGRLHVTPSSRLTALDRESIREHRDNLRALVAMCRNNR